MSRKGLIVFDIFMAIVIVMALVFGMQISTQKVGLEQERLLAGNVNKKFDLELTPEYQKKQAGEAVEVKVSLKNIDMGELGINNVVGYLSYDKSLFEEVNIQGVAEWHFEQNQNENHEMYGKFVIYTMKEGITNGQDILDISLKLKSDIKPQKTEIKFTGIRSSDGESSVYEEDRTAVIEIFDPEILPEEANPEESVPEVPAQKEAYSIKTGDNILLIAVVLTIATIILNAMIVFSKNDSLQHKTGLKVGIVSAISTIAVGLMLLAVTSLAHNSEITELINRLQFEEKWLNSEKYLVTDDTISRIAPLTTIGEISDKFNKDIEVYKKDSNEKVTDGLISTGMIIADGNDSYDAVVLGDIDGNGESDHIELTKIIRNILDNEKYKFNNIEKLAADMNIDNTMDMKDVNTSIQYILYGNLEISEFEQIQEPKIEIVGGTYNSVLDAYEDTVTVKVTAQDSNATSTKYKIVGTNTKEYTVIESGDTFEIEANGVYKVSAYSYGELGNRSKIPYQIVVKKNPNNRYRVITRAENADGTYSETIDERTGRIGKTVVTGDIIPEGYEINEGKSTLTGVIDENQVIDLIVTLDRKEYTLTLGAGDYISSVKIGEEQNNTTISKNFKFGKTVDISAEVQNQDGYTTTFDRWQSSDRNILSDNADKVAQIVMPMSNITLTGKANRTNNQDTPYTVEYYYQKDGFYSNRADASKQKNGETNSNVEVDETDKTPTKPEYVLDESKTSEYAGKVEGDGSLVLKVYFKQDLKVTYSKGNYGTFENQVTEHLEWGANTPEFAGELTHEEGYDFNGWSSTPADKVTETIEYVANWKEHEYTITYKLNGGTLGKDDQGNDLTNPEKYTISTENFTLKNPTKAGYTFKGWTGTDLNAESTSVTVEKGSIGDRSYEAKWEVIDYEITYNLNQGTLGFDDQGDRITNPARYNVETATFTLNNPTRVGYTFTGWTGTELTGETISVTVAKGSIGNRCYEANWRANSGVEYKVRYYLENLDSTDSANKDYYTLKEENTKRGVTDEDATAEILEYSGFTFDENNPNNKIADKIAGDGSLVLEVYYTRNSYTVTLDKDENVNTVTGANTYKYGAAVQIDATLKTEVGYTITFVKWKSSTADSINLDQLDDQFEKNANFTMPAGNVTLTAMSNKTADEVDYKVEFYYEEQGEYPEQVTGENVETRQAETDTMAYVTEQDKTTTRPTYVWDESKNGDLSGKVKGDGTLVLKVYFKQEFTVTYSKGTHGTFETQTTSNLRYNTDTPEFVGEKTHEVGYEFTSWDKTVENKVTKTVEYVAQWKATDYTIEYDLHGGTLGKDAENNDITNPTTYTVETENFTLNNPTRAGYTFKGWSGTDLSTETETVTIAKGSTGDRTYEAKWEVIEYNITYDLKEGHLLDNVTNPTSYNIETSTFTLNNPVRTGYTFLGWTGTGIDNVENPDQTVPQETVIVAQGSIGDRNYIANWQANTGVVYHVKYYLENLDSTDKNNQANYTLKEDKELDGTTDEEVTAEIKTYTGFTYDESNSNNKIIARVEGDGSLVLKVYYTRNSYTLTLAKDDYIDSVAGERTNEPTGNKVDETTLQGTFKYEEPVQISATLKTEQGYTITFREWHSTSTEILQADAEKKAIETSFAMPAEDTTVTAISNREANTVGYRVEFYYEGESGYLSTPTYVDETRTAKVATTVNVTNADKTADERNPGFRFDENADNTLTAIIPTSGTAVLKVYFKKAMFTLKVVAGDKVTEIKLGDETAGAGETLQRTYMYGTSITIDATVGTQEGYAIDFGKWKSSDTTLMADNTTKNLTFTMPDGDITLTAIADITPLDATYTIEYYYQVNGEYPATPGDSNIITRTGKTGQQVSITNADKEPITSGYIYDTDAENVETTDVNGIRPDGSTTLKVHFKEQFTVAYLPGEHANFEGTTIRNIDYNSEIPGYTGSTEGKDGFIFDSWKLTKIGETVVTEGTEIPTTVKANLEYTAQWKAMPTPEVTHEPTTWTNQNVTVTIKAPEGFEDYDIEYRIDDSTEWRAYSEPFVVEQNCVIHARLGIEDNKGEAVDYQVTNIDKVNPEFSDTPTFSIENNTAIVKANVTDNLSGVVEYGMRKDIYSGFTKHTCTNTLAAELTFDDAHDSGSYELYIKDAAGNTNTTTVEVEIPVHNVAKIVSAPAGFESLVGTEYESLTQALSTSDEAAQAGNVKIEIIDYIDNEENTIQNGRDYTINLNNYSVKNQEGKTAITVSGKLRLVDENAIGEGTLSSPFGLGAYITLDGELTLGKDGDGTPSIFSPIVEGASYGIKKEINYDAEKVYDENKEAYYYPEGVLNFYDGKVIGGTAAFMLQRVNDTPSLYDPTVATNQSTGNHESTLAIVSGIEAVIGKKRYMLLENAIEDANNVIGDSDTQVEITVVKDISKDADHKIVVDETKNIKLNLNGYVITSTTNDYVIKNYGKLEVYDSSSEKNELVCTKLASEVNIVSGTLGTYDGRNAINPGKDVNFDFDVTSSQKYKLAITGCYLPRATTVYLDGIEIYNLANSGLGDGWTTFNLNLGSIEEGTHNIRLYATGYYSPVYEKFQIVGNEPVGKITGSAASTIYNGISDAAKENLEYEDIDLSNVVANGNYYFETRAEGGLISNNGRIADTARSYIELDLTDRTGMYEVVVDSLISSRQDYDFGYVTVTYDTSSPDINYTYGRKIYKSGNGIDERTKFNLAGGEKYYIHFGYRKASTSFQNSDCFIIKNVKIAKIEKAGSLTIRSGKYENTGASGSYYEVFDNDGLMYVNGGNINTQNYYIEGIVNGKNSNSGYLEVNGGTFYTTYGRNIVNQNTALVKLNKGSFGKATNSYQNGYDEILYNSGALYMLSNDVVLNGVTGIETENGGKSVLDKGIINATYVNGVVNGAYSKTYVNDVTISASSYGIYNNNNTGITFVNGANITKAQYGIYNYYNGRIEIENINMTTTDANGIPTVSYGLYNRNAGKIIFNDGNIFSNYHAINSYSNGTIEVNGGTIRTYNSGYATIINNNGNNGATLIIRGGTITGPANGIYNLFNGKVTITGGLIESTGSNTIANTATGIVTVGSNDGEVSTTSPIIKSHMYAAVYNSRGTFKYYDGVLVGAENDVIRGAINDIPENYELVKELKEDNLQYITLGIPTNYVAKIAVSDNPDVSVLDSSYYKLEDGYYYFITLKSAVEACSKTNASQIDLIDAPMVYRSIVIDSEQDITIKTYGNKIYLNSAVDFENNGKLKIIGQEKEEGDTTKDLIAYDGMLFKNNEGAKLDFDNISISYLSEMGDSSNYVKIIDNYGTLNINNMRYRAYYSATNSYLYTYSIYNEETGTVNLENVTFEGNSIYTVYNYGKDKVDDDENTIYSVVMRNCSINGRSYGAYNMSTGTILVEGGIYNNSYQWENKSSGTMILRNTVIPSYVYNTSSGYMEIDNTEIDNYLYNQAAGKILIKGNESKLYKIYNSNVSGTVEIQAGTITYTSSGPTIDNNGKLLISRGTVTNTYNYSQAYAINNTNNAVATIYGENTQIISNYAAGINNTGTLTIGIEGGGVESRPIVKGKTYGVYSTGTFNFYDGIIEGASGTSIGGRVSRTEEGYFRVSYGSEEVYDDGTIDKYTVPTNKEISVLEQIEIVYVESTGRNYSTLKAALENTADTDTVKIINDITLSGDTESLTIAEGKNITFDLNGKNIQAGNTKLFINNGIFKIIDSTSHLEGDKLIEGSIVSGSDIILENNSSATIDNGTYRLTVGGDYNAYKNIFVNNDTLTVNGGTTKLESQYCNAIQNNENATCTMNNMAIIINANYGRGINNTKGTVDMKGGSITNNSSSSYSVYNNEVGDVTIESCTISNNYGVYNASNGTCTIKDGTTITGQVQNKSTGTINILGGTITYNGYAVYNTSSGTINIKKGTITGTGSTIYNYNSGTVNINGEELSADEPIRIIGRNNSDCNGIYNTGSGTINISGFVEIDTTSNNASYAERGINNTNSGTINIGKNGELDNRVKITSTDYAIVNFDSGKLNYYGGILTAPTAVHGFITYTSDNYEIIRSIDENNREVYKVDELDEAVSVGSDKYSNIADAIAEHTTGTIVIEKNIVMPNNKAFTVTSEHNVELDLNGHIVKIHTNGGPIVNEGTLKINDNTNDANGRMFGYSALVIQNKGNLEIANGELYIIQNSGNKIITNEGEGNINITGGTIYVRGTSTSNHQYYAIYATGGNSITMSGGYIKLYSLYYSGWWSSSSSYAYGIYATVPIDVTVTGGSFTKENQSTTYGICLYRGGNVTLSGNSNIDGDYGVCGYNDTMNVTVKDNVNITARYSIHSQRTGTIDIEGGTMKEISASSTNIVNAKAGSMTYISGGASDSGTSELNVYEGVIINNGSNVAISGFNKVNIYGGTITGGAQDPYKEFNMTGGSIIGGSFGLRLNNGNVKAVITDAVITATSGPGILVSSGTLTLGVNGEAEYPDSTTPAITGSTYGVQNSGGTFNFYDGILTGNTYATNGTVTNTPEMFTVIYSDGGKVGILGIEATFEQVATVNGIYYDDLAGAVNAAVNVNGRVELCKDITTSSNITIPADASITIDLYGFSINGYTASGALFTNNGTLVIEDTTNEGVNESTVRNYTGVAIVNNGTLVIGTNDNTVSTNAPVIMGATVALENHGIWDFVDGQITISEESGNIIENDGTARKPAGYSVVRTDNVYTLAAE